MTGRRARPSLAGPPDDVTGLRSFPRAELTTDQDLWRVVRRGRGPWWFNSSGGGRFDLRTPDGTCYLALDELSALLEVVGPDRREGAISRRFLDDRRLRRLQVSGRRSLADLTSRRCAGFGLTLEINTVVPYDLPRAWAASLRKAGADGLRYFVRHDPTAGQGVALFGRHGERRSWPRGREERIGPGLVERLRDECGIVVLAVPRLRELTVVEPG